MATKKTKKATTKSEPTFHSFAATLNAPLQRKASKPAPKKNAEKIERAKSQRAADQLKLLELQRSRLKGKSKPAGETEAASKPEAKTRAAKPKAEKGPKRLSALNAAAKVLVDSGTPMSCKALVESMSAKGLWNSPNGKTPHATLYSAILREIATKGKDARFKKTDRGQFAAP